MGYKVCQLILYSMSYNILIGAVDPMKGYYTQREFRNLVRLDRFRQIIGWEDYDALDIGCPLYVYWKLPGRCYTGAGFYLSVKCSEEELP